MNSGLLRRFPYASTAFTLGLVTLLAAVFWDIDVFDLPGVSLIGVAHGEVGEIAIAFLLIIPAVFVDRLVARQRTHEGELHAEQLRVLRVTMRTVQDIVNNNLNQLQLLRLEAENHVSEQTLRLFDDALRDTTTKLTALGNMKTFAERPMASGAGLDIGASSGAG